MADFLGKIRKATSVWARAVFGAMLLFCVIGAYDAFAAGYSCTKTYNTCNAGYYLSNGDCNTAPSGWTCPGGTGGANTCYKDVTLSKNGRYVNLGPTTPSGPSDCFVVTIATGTNSATLRVFYNTSCTLPTYAAGTEDGYYYSGWSTSSALNATAATTIPATTTAPTATYYMRKSGCAEGYYKNGTSCSSCGAGSTNTAGNTLSTCTCWDWYSADGTSGGARTVAGGVACHVIEYTVTLNAHGGTGGTSTLYPRCDAGWYLDSARTQTLNPDCAYAITAPTRTGYTFNGYYSAATGGQQYITNSGCITAAGYTSHGSNYSTTCVDHEWHAQWTAETSTVTLNANGGTAGTTTSVTATYDSAMPVPTNNTHIPTRTGYTFAGFYDTDAATGGNMYYKADGTSNKTWDKTGAQTLYARWTANTYIINYALNSGTHGATHPTSATYDTAFTVSNPTRAGYIFAGWNITGMENGVTHTLGSSTSTGTSANGIVATSFKNLRATSGTVTFTAQWQQEKFSVTTTSSTTSLIFSLSAKGTFYVDCGDGGTLNGTGVSGNTITRTNTTSAEYTCSWSSGTHTVRFAGSADNSGSPYNTNTSIPAISFYKSSGGTQAKIASATGSLSALFPRISATAGQYPTFFATFMNATSLTSVPDTLFANLQGGAGMFNSTFRGTGLTSVPAGLFGGVTTAADGMFTATFRGCSNLTTIYAGLFGNITGGATDMFNNTFRDCSKLSAIPTGLFAHINTSASQMFMSTFYGCSALNSIPTGLFSGITGSASATSMFGHTFRGCTNITAIPDDLFSNITTASQTLFQNTFYGCSKLAGYIPPTTFAGLIGAGSPPATNMWDGTFSGTNLITNCATVNKSQYITHYEGSTNGSTWNGKVSCRNACTSGMFEYGTDGCANNLFSITTTSSTSSFSFKMSAKGTFWVNWGDGTSQVITRTNTTPTEYSHTYASTGSYTIKFSGVATEYNADPDVAAITFYKESGGTQNKIASVSGSLGDLFEQFSDEPGDYPSFYQTFRGATSLGPTIPFKLFDGISGGEDMFKETFYDCVSLTSVPAGLFMLISDGAPGMFDSTFSGATGLATLPNGLFASIETPAEDMFRETFSTTNLSSVPADLFGGLTSGAAGMFEATFFDATNLTSVPAGLFSNITSTANDEFMFAQTFQGCSKLTTVPGTLFNGITKGAPGMFDRTFSQTGLTSIPAGLFSHVTTAANELFTGTFDNNSQLTSYIPPTTFAGLIANSHPTATNMWKNTFRDTNVATSCTSYTGKAQYITGYEGTTNGSTWNTRVSCDDATYTITLNKNTSSSDSTSAGTIYAKYNTGIYTTDALTTQITTSSNNAPKPTRSKANNTTYTFNGYWTARTGGTQMINANGSLTSSFTSTTYTSNTTLYAQWKMTCDAGYMIAANALQCSACTAGYYCAGNTAYSVSSSLQGRSNCPSGYNQNSNTGAKAESECQISCAAGTRVVALNATSCTTPAGAWYTGAHMVNYGHISPVTYCMSGYTTTGTAASNHDAATDCTLAVLANQYLPAMTIPARYIKVTSTGSTSNVDTHVIEIAAYASNNATGTNLLSGKTGPSGGDLGNATDGSWARRPYAGNNSSTPLIWDMGSVQNIGSIKFAMYTDGRTYHDVTISVSTDNSTWTTVWGPNDLPTDQTGSNSAVAAGDVIVLSGVPTACATGYSSSATTLAYGQTNSCTAQTSTVSFNANGGSGGQSADVTATYGSAMPTISTTKPTRTGYTFMGWYDNSNYAASGAKQYYTASGGSARTYDKTAATTLYAGWKANTFTVSFDSDSEDISGSCASVTCTYDQPCTAQTYGESCNISYDDDWVNSRILTGWATTKNGPKVYDLGGNIQNIGTKTLYPVWTMCSDIAPSGEHIASVHASYAGGNVCYYSQACENGYRSDDEIHERTEAITCSACPGGKPANSTWSSDCMWHCDTGRTIDGIKNGIVEEDSCAECANMSCDLVQSRIRYHMDGGVNYNGAPKTYNALTQTITLGTPTKVNATFAGWYNNASFTGSPITQINTNSQTDFDLYAKWTCTTGNGPLAADNVVMLPSASIVPDGFRARAYANDGTSVDYTSGGTGLDDLAPGEWEDKYTSSSDKGIIRGMSACTTSTASTSDSFTGNETGKNCWCKATDWTNEDGESYSLDSSWANANPYGSAGNCAKSCANYCGSRMVSRQATRTAVLGANMAVAGNVCSPVYNITYYDGATQLSGLTPATYTSGDPNIMVDAVPTKNGYSFVGWCTDSALTNCAQRHIIPADATGGKSFYAKWVSNTPVFTVATTSIPANGEFKFSLSAAGVYVVDWGDGNVQVIDRTGDTTLAQYSHKYTSAGTHTIGFNGETKGYTSTDNVAAIRFGAINSDGNTPDKIASVGGSLGALFPTLSSAPSGMIVYPQFANTFSGCTEITSLPNGLFNGVTGAYKNMFRSTFGGCTKLTTIPGNLFNGISGAAENMFYATFANNIALTSVPSGIFNGISGAAPYMFYGTFLGCTTLTTIPTGLFNGISGAADSMFKMTFYNDVLLNGLPNNLFNGISGAAPYMFDNTFYNCNHLTSLPNGLFSGVTGGAPYLFRGTFSDCTSLTSVNANLFGNAAGTTSADHMFSSTFYHSGLTSVPSGLFSKITNTAEYMFNETFAMSTSLKTVPSNLFSHISTAPKTNMFYHAFYGDTALDTFDYGNNKTSDYIPKTFFERVSTTPAATKFMTGIFDNTAVATTCPTGYEQYITGFEEYFGSKVSCDIGVYDITYNMNGGFNSLDNPETYTYGVGVSSFASPVKKPNMTFGGWYDNASFTGSPITSIATNAYGDKSLYAKWSCATGYTPMSSDGTITLPSTTTVPDGFRAKAVAATGGTSVDYTSGGTGLDDLAPGEWEDKYTTGTVGKLRGISTCTTSTASTSNSLTGNETGPVCWCRATAWTDEIGITKPLDSSWANANAYASAENCAKSCANYCGSRMVSRQVTRTAVLGAVNGAENNYCAAVYTITYYDGTTQLSGIIPATYTASVGTTINATPSAKTGYTFAGWCTEAALTNCAMNPSLSTTDTGNKTYYAKWTANTNTITLNGNSADGGKIRNTAMTSGTVTFTCKTDATISLPTWSATDSATTTSIYKGKKRFLGWATSNTATAAETIITCPTGNKTYYAVWSADCSCDTDSNATCEVQNTSNNTCQYKHTCTTGYYNTNNGVTVTSNAMTCTACPAGSFCVAGATAPTQCAVGSYTSTTGQSACTACQDGTTTSAAGQTSCNANCSAIANLATWATSTWNTNNTMSNLCVVATCQAGSYKSNNACPICDTDKYSSAGASSCTPCLTNYHITGTARTDHDSSTDCKIACSGGSYIKTANDTSCTNVGAGNWAAASTIAQGSKGSVTACSSGLTTIGYGAGADEAGDCGRKFHAGEGMLYLRSTKKTNPSLNVKVGGTVFYGNMEETEKNMSDGVSKKLKVKDGGTVYYVHDDSVN